MPTCPNCGEIVMNGDPYCSHCGATFRWDDDIDFGDYSYGSKSAEDSPVYDWPFDGIRELSEEEYAKLKPVRDRYVERYVRHVKDLEYGDAHAVYDEYVAMHPGDFLFLKMISINARQFLDSELVDEISYRLDMLDGW